MNPLLISGFGTSIKVEKRKLIITNKLKDETLEFYPHKIDYDNIILDNHSGFITFDSMRWLMKHNIPLTILNWDGNILGITLPDSPVSGKLKIKQYQTYLSKNKRYDIAENLVFSKIDSSFNLIKNLSNYHLINLIKIKDSFEKEKRDFLNKKDREQTLVSLMTYEVRIAQVYFDALGTIFAEIAPEFNFQARKVKENARNYNASDEINALLNYGYSILESEIRKILNSYGLDPEIGYLHSVLPSRKPLVYDFQELFRWIIDLSVIQLLESTKLKKLDFIITENYHIRLKDSVASLLINKIKNNFRIKVPYKGKNYFYENILSDNVSKLSLFISEKNNKIEFNVPNLSFKRNDYLSLKEKIVKMTPEEKKD
ncbi:MAG: CRISPR-associated endonuclease Cas1 [Nitrosopumilus sp.]|nr:CRISPR-associated endonuclease Cas1 [Nitrosopumilus sp.]